MLNKYLSSKGSKDFDDIVSHKVLGASNHISMIHDMALDIVSVCESEGLSIIDSKTRILELIDFFKDNRGSASVAIYNAMEEFARLINKVDNETQEELTETIVAFIELYNNKKKVDLDKIIKYSLKKFSDCNRIMIYDYSSTVEAVIKALMSENQSLELVVPESRAINGGVPYIKGIDYRKRIHFIPDVSMQYYMKSCDALIMGAETCFPDGTGFNTIGSDIAALIAKTENVPLYFLTPLNKMDNRPITGFRKDLVYIDLEKKYSSLLSDIKGSNQMQYTTPELIGVNPNYINSYITELGVIPAISLYAVYLSKENGGN